MRFSDINGLLQEGVKFGRTEVEEIIRNHTDYRIGIEYEFLSNNTEAMTNEDFVRRILAQENFPHVFKVHSEHDGMTEIVTTIIPSLMDGFNHIKAFFDLAEKYNFSFPHTAGMHVSISHVSGSSRNIDLVKFIVLLAGDYIHSVFPQRKYVDNINSAIKNLVHDHYPTYQQRSGDQPVEVIENIIKDYLIPSYSNDTAKHITAKVSDFFSADGRIELRFIGGNDYNKRFDDIKYHTIRACFILGIAFDDTLYRNEYLKTLAAFVPPPPSKHENVVASIINGDIDLDDIPRNKLVLLYQKTNSTKMIVAVLNNTSERIPEFESILVDMPFEDFCLVLKNPDSYMSIYYDDTDERWGELEERFISLLGEYKDNTLLNGIIIHYTVLNSQETSFSNLEEAMIHHKQYTLLAQYMVSMDMYDWEEGKAALVNDIDAAMFFVGMMNTPIPELEEIIYTKEHINHALDYIDQTEQGRVPEIEPFITNLYDIERYYQVVDDYWPEAMNLIYDQVPNLPERGIKRRSIMNGFDKLLSLSFEYASNPHEVYDDFITHYLDYITDVDTTSDDMMSELRTLQSIIDDTEFADDFNRRISNIL